MPKDVSEHYPVKPGYYWARWTVAADGAYAGMYMIGILKGPSQN